MPFISRQILGPVLFILLFLLIVLRIFLPDTNRNYTYDPMERLMQEQRMFLDPSLPHSEYKRKEDSIRRRILEENSFHNSRGDSWSIISFGPSVFKYQIGNSKEYYFSMAGYYLKNDSYFFFEKRAGTMFQNILKTTGMAGFLQVTIRSALKGYAISHWEKRMVLY